MLVFPIGLWLFSFVSMLHSPQPQRLSLFGLLLVLSLVHVGPPAQAGVGPGGIDPVGVVVVLEPSRDDDDDDDDDSDDDDDGDDGDDDGGPPLPPPPPPLPPPPAPPPPPPVPPPSPPPPAGLSLTVTDAPDPVTAGQPVTYTLMIGNNGARSAKGVTLTDDLPAAVTRGAVTTTQGACGGTDPVGCNLGRIESGAQAIVIVSVTPTRPGTLTNQAWVAAKKNDPNAGNNSVSTETTVVDVISATPLGLENPLSAGCEFVNGEIACPETALQAPSASMSISQPARALSSSTMRSPAPMKAITAPCISMMSPRQSPEGQASCEEARYATTGLPLPRALSPCCHPLQQPA